MTKGRYYGVVQSPSRRIRSILLFVTLGCFCIPQPAPGRQQCYEEPGPAWALSSTLIPQLGNQSSSKGSVLSQQERPGAKAGDKPLQINHVGDLTLDRGMDGEECFGSGSGSPAGSIGNLGSIFAFSETGGSLRLLGLCTGRR